MTDSNLNTDNVENKDSKEITNLINEANELTKKFYNQSNHTFFDALVAKYYPKLSFSSHYHYPKEDLKTQKDNAKNAIENAKNAIENAKKTKKDFEDIVNTYNIADKYLTIIESLNNKSAENNKSSDNKDGGGRSSNTRLNNRNISLIIGFFLSTLIWIHCTNYDNGNLTQDFFSLLKEILTLSLKKLKDIPPINFIRKNFIIILCLFLFSSIAYRIYLFIQENKKEKKDREIFSNIEKAIIVLSKESKDKKIINLEDLFEKNNNNRFDKKTSLGDYLENLIKALEKIDNEETLSSLNSAKKTDLNFMKTIVFKICFNITPVDNEQTSPENHSFIQIDNHDSLTCILLKLKYFKELINEKCMQETNSNSTSINVNTIEGGDKKQNPIITIETNS